MGHQGSTRGRKETHKEKADRDGATRWAMTAAIHLEVVRLGPQGWAGMEPH